MHRPADDTALAEAAERLRAGGLVAFPTETVYGLGADARSPDAVGRVFALKGRPAGNPLIVHAAGVETARACASAWPEGAGRLAERFWPGPLTLVLPKAAWVPEAVTAGGPTVAVRCPDHPVALALIGACGFPLVGPSANPSGRLSPTRAEHVREAFAGRVPGELLVLDGGPCARGLESTVLDLAGPRPRVLRPGVIGPAELSEALGVAVAPDTERPAEGSPGPAASPGLLGPHYRPRAPVRVFSTLDELAALLDADPGPAAVLSPPGAPVAVAPPHGSFAMPGRLSDYAAELYAALHEADAMGPALIAVGLPPPSAAADAREAAILHALLERLGRAATP